MEETTAINRHPNERKYKTAMEQFLQTTTPITVASFRDFYKKKHGSLPSKRAIDTAMEQFKKEVAQHNIAFPPIKAARTPSIAAFLDAAFPHKLPNYTEAASAYRQATGKAIAMTAWRKWKVPHANKLGVVPERSQHNGKSAVKKILTQLFPHKDGGNVPPYTIAAREYFIKTQKTLNTKIFAEWQKSEVIQRAQAIQPANAQSKAISQKIIACLKQLLLSEQPIRQKQIAQAYKHAHKSDAPRYNLQCVVKLFALDIEQHNKKIGVPMPAAVRPRVPIAKQLCEYSPKQQLTYEQACDFYKQTRGKKLPERAWQEYLAAW